MPRHDSQPLAREVVRPGPGDTMPDPAQLDPGLLDGRYALERAIGRGTFGTVHLATDVWLERTVCIKLIAPEHVADEQVARRFRREAVAAASVRSDHVAQVHAFGRHGAGYYLAMEYVPGPDLQHLIDTHGARGARVPFVRAISILRQVCDGAAAIHDAGIVHRDIKPKNVVIEEATGRPVLIDFGLALRTTEKRRISEQLVVIGTPEYMAPETVDPSGRSGISVATDVYALGCSAFELLTGRPPFEHVNPFQLLRMHVTHPVPRISERDRQLEPLDEVLRRALAKSPHDRFPSARELGKALDEAGKLVRPPPAHEAFPEVPSVVQRLSLPDMPTVRPMALSASRRVLVVDDDPEFRHFAMSAAQVAFYGHDVRIKTVKTGTHAIHDVMAKPPDLILLDHDMPGLHGVETLSRIRDLAHGARARVVVVSGKTPPELRAEFEVLGVEAFVSKPVQMPALVDTIARVAESAGWLKPSLRGGADDD